MRNSFIRDTMNIFAVDILMLVAVTYFFGEEARGLSTMFQLGANGLALETIIQFFLSAAVIAGWRWLFFSQRILKNMMMLWRTLGMLFAVIVSMVGFIAVCGWFPVNNVEGWIGFIVSFAVCFGVSAGYMILKTHYQSRRYDELLKKYHDRYGGQYSE